MFKYDDVYNLLFENKDFLNILYKFHTSNFDNLDKNERNNLIKEFIDKYCEILKIDQMKFKKGQSKSYAGAYIDIGGSVMVNIDNNCNQYDVMDTLFHELRHNFQHRAVSKNLTELESVDEEQVRKWKVNFLSSPRGYSNYISTKGEYSELYYYQPVEKDAFMTALSLTKKSHDLIAEKFGRDTIYEMYGRAQKIRVMLYFCDEKEWVENMKIAESKVEEIFAKNNKEKEIEKKCLIIAKKTMEKEIEEMSIEELLSLFSVYVWSYLDDEYKFELLKEYDSRVNKYKPIKIEMDGNSAFKINGNPHERNQIIDIINTMATFQFESYAKAVVKGIAPSDEKTREEIRLNLFKDGNKRINYVKDSENFFLYSIQPYALLEGKMVIELFKKIKETEIEIYGINTGYYDDMIDYYDYDKYKPFVEKFYGRSFDEIYEDIVNQMKEKVNKVSKR